MNFRIGKGTVALYLAISALLPLAIYLLLSWQAERHPVQGTRLPDHAAQHAPAPGTAAGTAHATPSSRSTGAWGDGKTSAGPPDDTDPPAHGAPYNWTFMAYSSVLMLIMLGFVLWLIRRSSRRRADS